MTTSEKTRLRMNSRQPSSEDGLETKVPYLHMYKWTRDEWQSHDMITERLKERIQPKGRNQRNMYKSVFDHFRQKTESFIEFWTELKRKFELARISQPGEMTTETAVSAWMAT